MLDAHACTLIAHTAFYARHTCLWFRLFCWTYLLLRTAAAARRTASIATRTGPATCHQFLLPTYHLRNRLPFSFYFCVRSVGTFQDFTLLLCVMPIYRTIYFLCLSFFTYTTYCSPHLSLLHIATIPAFCYGSFPFPIRYTSPDTYCVPICTHCRFFLYVPLLPTAHFVLCLPLYLCIPTFVLLHLCACHLLPACAVPLLVATSTCLHAPVSCATHRSDADIYNNLLDSTRTCVVLDCVLRRVLPYIVSCTPRYAASAVRFACTSLVLPYWFLQFLPFPP